MRFSKKLQTAVLLLAALSMATPTQAGIYSLPKLIPTILKKILPQPKERKEAWECYLQGVNECGCLTDCGGTCATYCAVINCKTGKFTGTAKACVQNLSCRKQCYRDVNYLYDCNVIVECAQYTVEKSGKCCYTASGCLRSGAPA